MPGTHDNPVRLDPFQMIRNVGWGGSRMVLLEFFYQTDSNYGAGAQSNTFFASFTDFPKKSLIGAAISDNIGTVITPPEASAQVKKDADIWCYPAKKTVLEEPSTGTFVVNDRTLNNIQTSAGIYTSVVDPLFGILVPFYIDDTGDFSGGGDLNVISPAEVFGYIDLATGGLQVPFMEPLTIEVVRSHTVLGASKLFVQRKANTATFLNMARLKKYAVDGRFLMKILMAGQDRYTLSQWAVAMSTWKNVGRWGFEPVDYTILNSKDQTDFRQLDQNNSEGVAPPAEVTFEFDVNTMLVTQASKTNVT